ncbi:MAG: response regulator [Magnetococcales bacterium]|nr:response regulator [Magnetococcales bacterium]
MDQENPPLSQEASLTTTEAGRRLGVSQRTIHNWVELKNLPSWKTPGGHRRIPKSAVNEIIRQRQEKIQKASGAQAVSILVVEDDLAMMTVYKSMIQAWSFPLDLMTAANGFDALIQVGKKAPDIIITDLVMPNVDGIEMVRVLREKPELTRTRFVVVTLLDPEEITRRGGLPEDIPVFQKPVPAGLLKALVGEKAIALGINIKKR